MLIGSDLKSKTKIVGISDYIEFSTREFDIVARFNAIFN